MIPWTSDIPLSVFVTRAKFGDPRCAVFSNVKQTEETIVIPECNIHTTSDTFHVNFLYHSTPQCRPGAVQINAHWDVLRVGESTITTCNNSFIKT